MRSVLIEAYWLLTSILYKGVWLLDPAQHVSNCVELYGNDVSSIHFPKVHPKNVQFHVASVTKLPDDWSAKFDLIHQRLLIGALTAGHWQEAIPEMLRVLKPGGSIQLVEFHSLDTTNAGPTWTRFRVIFEKLLAKRNMMRTELSNCHACLTKPVSSMLRGAGQIGKTAAAYIMIGFQSMGPAILVEGLVASELEFEELMADVRRECDGPLHIEQAVWMVCARKPL